LTLPSLDAPAKSDTFIMNLKLTTLLALFAASPLTMGGLTILAPEKFKDSAKVRGRNLSEGEIVLMSRATSDTNSSEVCADPVLWQPVTSDSHCKTKVYNGITELWFSEPTKDPPPIDVTINGNECYHVSQNHNQ